MKKLMMGVCAVAVAAIVGGCRKDAAVSANVNKLQIGDVTFLEVNGESQLPLEFMRTGQNRDKLETVRMGRYWIAEKPISKAVFARVMGNTSVDQPSEEPIGNIEWSEAETFCKCFTEMNQENLPTNCLVSLPTMMEWVHAVNVLKGKVDFADDKVGTFLFTVSSNGGYLHTMWPDLLLKETNVSLAVDFAITPKRCKIKDVGLRPILLDAMSQFQDQNQLVIRGVIALRYGEFALAESYLQAALKSGSLSEESKEEAEEMLNYAKEAHKYDFEDWSGLVAVSTAFAERRGYVTQPFALHWQMIGLEENSESDDVVSAYENAGIKGKWMRLCDLPKELKKDQCIGDDYLMPIRVGEKLESAEMKVDPNFVIQTLECDIDGDGQKDLVTEDFGSVGSGGYWYSFYRGLPDGSYTNVLQQQLVGLCVLPHAKGQGCGFLVVEKESNPVLAVSLLSFSENKPQFVSANERSFYMLDASEDMIYRPAPFIGAGYGLGWSFYRSKGVWYRPLYWPWKPGTVQGYEDARKQVKQKLLEKAPKKKDVKE